MLWPADFNNSFATDIHVSEGFSDIFVSKYKPNSGFEWALTVGGAGADHACSAKIHDTLLYVLGEMEDTVDFDPDSLLTDTFITEGYRDIAVLHFSLPVIEIDTNTTAVISENRNGFIVYPNPFTSKINIENETGTEYFELVNAQGQLVWSGKNIETADFSGLSEGIYVLKIRRDEVVEMVSVIKK
jgi:hypothetical protein